MLCAAAEAGVPCEMQDALTRDFTNYLGILKAVHSGADMQASAAAAGNK